MLRPFLLVGVGGSGGKTLRVIHEDLSRRLAHAGWTGDLPQAWQFLHIDVPTFADGDDPDLPPQLPMRSYRGLVAPGLTYKTIDAALAGTGRTAAGDALAGWRPDPNNVNVSVSKGAGQFRTLGRIIALASMDRIREALEQAKRALTGTQVVGQLQDATRRLGGEALPAAPDPTVLVISSIAGGSGAGAIIDVCDAIRALGDPWASESVGILYAPDVFDYLADEQRRGVRPNALATLCELLSGYWSTNGASPETADLLAKYGVQVGTASRLGPRYPFIVGNRNEFVSFNTQNDIYRAMGRSLASWVSSSPLQDRMTGYVQGNWSSSASAVVDHLPLRPLGTESPFSALGSARVGLGRDRFRDYASETLARQAVEIVLRRHEQYRQPDDERTTKKLVGDVADINFGGFLAQSGLHERGEDTSDIVSALRPENEKEAAHELAAAVTSKVTSEIPPKGWSAQLTRQRIVSEIVGREARFHDEQRTARLERARTWVIDIQDRLTRLTALTVAREGAPVTADLIDKLATELTQVRDELRDEAARYRRWAADLETQVANAIEQGGADILLAATPSVANAVKRGVEAVVWQAEAQVRDLAAQIIPDLVDGFVIPLGGAVRRAGEKLLVEEGPQPDGKPSLIALWPVDDHIPERLHPAGNEFLVDAMGTYPKTLQRLIERTVASTDRGGSRHEVTMQVLLGIEDLKQLEGDHPLDQQLIVRTTDWSPADYALRKGSTGAPSPATFEVSSAGRDLLDRAVSWVTRPATPIGAYVAEGLKDYLDPATTDPEQHANRLQRFEAQFIAAINAAAPLVSINPGVLVAVHSVHEAPSSLYFTDIPFPERSPARETVKRVLQGRGLWSEEVAKSLTDAGGASIDVFSVLGTPYEPVVFDSLIKPIASEWGSRSKTADMRAEFWRWRRARSLTEFLPLAPATLRAMVRGWFTAGLFGQLDLEKMTIFVPSETGGQGLHLPFPEPLLAGHQPQAYDLLPFVLESLPLALVAVNTKSSLDPIRPYARLRDLGKSGRGGAVETYDTATAELEVWITEGRMVGGAPPSPPRAGSEADGWEGRRTAAERQFADLEKRYSEKFREVEARTDVFDVPMAYELRSEIIGAFHDLERAVRHVDPSAGNSGWN